ncbi:MAG: M20/M25/M40 family metallo-hydrolase [Vampirovibrio sp.]|nr:M20/M25/M40 family metallo-hydrolase [Vampirovibrio sp.]
MLTTSIDTEKLLATFLEMVRIDSPSGAEEKMRAYLEERLVSMGLETRVDAGGNLFCDIPGEQCTHDSLLVVSGHMDVVPPCLGVQPMVTGSGMDRVITSDNTTVLGADDKSALAVIIEGLAVSIAEKRPRPPIRLILTTREEVVLAGAKEIDVSELDGKFSVIFDHTGEQGIIITEAPSFYELNVHFRGKSVHAGIMPEKGVNALVYASKVIDAWRQAGLLGRVDADTTTNIGTLKGGKGTNVVPDHLHLWGELRGHNQETLERVMAEMKVILEDQKTEMPGADYELLITEAFTMFKMDESHPGVQRVAAAAEQTGLTPQFIRTNGGSDNNVFVNKGLPGVVLSAGYIAPHSLKESILLKDLTVCGEFYMNIMNAFAETSF